MSVTQLALFKAIGKFFCQCCLTKPPGTILMNSCQLSNSRKLYIKISLIAAPKKCLAVQENVFYRCTMVATIKDNNKTQRAHLEPKAHRGIDVKSSKSISITKPDPFLDFGYYPGAGRTKTT
jgi:hypothetical protein